MTFKYKFNLEHLELMESQIWEMKKEHGGATVYDELAPYEVEQIKDYLPQAPDRILELGAGLGRGSIYLRHYFRENGLVFPPIWVLADRDGFSEENTGAFNPKVDEYYNDFKLGRSFCQMNGLDNFKFVDTETGDWSKWGKFDFIFSFCSFGMHVPLERYMDRLIGASLPDVTMIFGTRHAGYNGDSFKDKFKEVIYQQGAGRQPFPHENWLILRGVK